MDLFVNLKNPFVADLKAKQKLRNSSQQYIAMTAALIPKITTFALAALATR